MAAILVVEDDPATADEIVTALRAHGHAPHWVESGAAALASALDRRFDAITLDRLLPDTDGLSVIAALRRAGVRAPVLMLSALGDVDERIAGLRAGGDDYLTKPFVPTEMAVRIEVLLRRGQGATETRLRAGAIEMDLILRVVTIAGRPVKLLQMEFKLLEFLLRHAGSVVSRRMLFEQVWQYHFDPGPNLIQVHIARLRRKIDAPGAPSAIVTVKGEGYRLDPG
ncbi:response regulator transcription factor [Sphingomonas morindae]|uniref:Response regulator transcription factor n=1 Tax=Sphingomonas morindae TaxID=1541170 RepID=A0ABY4X523_9SPHN|nr:response regulator transcription factor [Sphingomonas morindae]USI71994.1 response regulator transcription factor [Sphingomonas morindae]